MCYTLYHYFVTTPEGTIRIESKNQLAKHFKTQPQRFKDKFVNDEYKIYNDTTIKRVRDVFPHTAEFEMQILTIIDDYTHRRGRYA